MKILVGISGSIGVLGIPAHLISLQVQSEVEELRIIMTPTAARFVNPRTLEALLQLPIQVDPWTDGRPMYSPPELVKDVDLFLIAPASATTLSRCANGSGETLLSHCYLSYSGLVAFAPSMAPEMRAHPAVARNIERLQADGACILPPGPSYSAALGTFVEGGTCPYQQMWPILKSLLEERQRPGRRKARSSRARSQA
jgi:phosphopantothenoylcysteine decarboxylase / phosphopantothenate---cysteine ligase